jgi:hypothetical protein
MDTSIDLFRVANAIADCCLAGVEIAISNKAYCKRVTVTDIDTGERVGLNFWPDGMKICKASHVSRAAIAHKRYVASKPAVKAIEHKKTSKWWSRFNFEHNIMKMCWLALQDQFPHEEKFAQAAFAQKLAIMMSWATSTAARHINRAAKLGILNRTKVGSSYYITGLNDGDAQSLQQATPEPRTIPFSNYYLEEGKPALEMAIDKAVDETILP